MTRHDWVAPLEFNVDDRQALIGSKRKRLQLSFELTVPFDEVYCYGCHRPYERVFGVPCAALRDNAYLIGGPTGRRKARTHKHDCIAYGCIGTGISSLAVDALQKATKPGLPGGILTGGHHGVNPDHEWVANAVFHLTDVDVETAREAQLVQLQSQERVQVLDILCRECQRPFELLTQTG
jgi:hypothetical protein